MTGDSRTIALILTLMILLLMPVGVQGLERPAAQQAGQVPGPAQDQPAESDKPEEFSKDPWRVKWERFRKATRDISEFDYRDGMFRMRFGLRFQWDGTLGFESQGLEDQFGRIPTTGRARRARIFADGDFLRRYHYRFEYDFGEDQGLKDAYVDGIFQNILRVAELRVGNAKEPFGLEQHTSNYFRVFMEPALPVAVFVPGHNLGMTLHALQARERMYWAFGFYTNTQDTEDNNSSSDFTFTGRGTGLPVYRDGGRRLLHIGLSFSQRNPSGDTIEYNARPEARFAPQYLDTGPFAASQNTLGALELALVNGPYWFQTEWIQASPDTDDYGQLNFWGYYAQFGWFITGEHRPYMNSEGCFGRLEPLHPMKGGNLFKKGNHGALELIARISTVDLNDGAVAGGEMTNLSVGMNWYLTRATRLMFNYVYSDVNDGFNDGLGHANIFMIRYQFNPGYSWPQLNPKKFRKFW